MPALYWVEEPPLGRVGVSERPRGGVWLPDDMRSLRDAGVDILVSALPEEEMRELWLEDEGLHAREAGMDFFALPIPNLMTPKLDDVLPALKEIADRVAAGHNLATHCFGGVGRSPMLAVSVLVLLGMHPAHAWERLQVARGRIIPDTHLQRLWVEQLIVP